MEKNSFIETLYKNAGYYCVALISLVYVSSSLILISKTGKSVYEIIGTGFISLTVGSLISGSFRSIGIRRGEEDERTVLAIKAHAQIVKEIMESADGLDEFCERENKIAIKRIRTKILSRVGLKYDDCFDENGICKELNLNKDKESRRKNRKIKKAYVSAVNLKIKELTSGALTSDGGKSDDPFNFGKSKGGYSKTRSISDIFVRILMAIIFGYFGVSLVSEINFATIIWNTLQIVMYVSSGIIGMYSAFTWIVEDYRQGINKKIDYLKKFKLLSAKSQL